MATPQQDYKVLNTLTNEQLKNKYIDIMNTNFKYADQHILKHANKLIERLFKTKSTETLSKQKFEDKLAMTIWAMDQTLEASSHQNKTSYIKWKNGRTKRLRFGNLHA